MYVLSTLLFLNNKILYIGRAQRLGRRWHTHHRLTQLEYIGRVKIAWLVIEPHVLIDPMWLEEECIRHLSIVKWDGNSFEYGE